MNIFNGDIAVSQVDHRSRALIEVANVIETGVADHQIPISFTTSFLGIDAIRTRSLDEKVGQGDVALGMPIPILNADSISTDIADGHFVDFQLPFLSASPDADAVAKHVVGFTLLPHHQRVSHVDGQILNGDIHRIERAATFA